MGGVDKKSDQWTIFLKGLGLTVGLETVRKVAIQVVSQAPLYPLYATQGTTPVAGKGTVYKIKGLIEDGRLDPLLYYWGFKETPEVDSIQLAHLKDLGKFLQEDYIRNSFAVEAPGSKMESKLKQLVPRAPSIWLRVCHFAWEDLPIVSNIRSHCLDHKLWKDINEWKRRQDEYERSILYVAEKLQAEFHDVLHSPGIEITDPTLERNLLLDIFNWLAGQLLGNVPRFGLIWTKSVEKREGQIFHLAWGDRCYVQGTWEQIEHARKATEDILKRWSNSDDMRLLVRQYYFLEVLAQKMRDDVEHIDEAVLAQGTCQDCPTLGLQRPQKGD